MASAKILQEVSLAAAKMSLHLPRPQLWQLALSLISCRAETWRTHLPVGHLTKGKSHIDIITYMFIIVYHLCL